MPAHSGKYLDREFESDLNNYGSKAFDQSWLYMSRCQAIDYRSLVLGDTGIAF